MLSKIVVNAHLSSVHLLLPEQHLLRTSAAGTRSTPLFLSFCLSLADPRHSSPLFSSNCIIAATIPSSLSTAHQRTTDNEQALRIRVVPITMGMTLRVVVFMGYHLLVWHYFRYL